MTTEAPPDPGARQATGTLAAMLLAPVRDMLALADGPLSAQAIAPREEWLRERLLELGVATVASSDSPPEWGDAPVDIVVVDATDEDLGPEAALLTAARAETAGICMILSADAGASAAAAREAGFAKVSLIEPPADAERRYVLHERTLLVAWGDSGS
jgi:hypothetical protein